MEVDEKILAMRNEQYDEIRHPEQYLTKEALKEEMQSSIYDEQISIFNKKVHCVDKNLLDNLVSLHLPEDFKPMDKELIRKIYFNGNPPQLVLSDAPEYYFSVALSHLDYSITENGLKSYAENIFKILDALGPKTNFIKLEMIQSRDDTPIAQLEFSTRAIDTAVYNIQFYACIKNKVLMGSINFPYERRERLLPLAREIITSLKNLQKIKLDDVEKNKETR